MDELLHHLANDDMHSLFPDGYDHVLAEVYNVLYYAVRDRADALRLSAKDFVWSKQQAKIKEHPLQTKSAASYRSQLLLILQNDPILQKYVRVVTDSADELAIVFAER